MIYIYVAVTCLFYVLPISITLCILNLNDSNLLQLINTYCYTTYLSIWFLMKVNIFSFNVFFKMLYFHYGELFFHIHCSCIYCSLCLFMVSFLEFSSLLNLECVLRYSLRVESIVLKINILLSQIYLLLSFCTDWR